MNSYLEIEGIEHMATMVPKPGLLVSDDNIRRTTEGVLPMRCARSVLVMPLRFRSASICCRTRRVITTCRFVRS